MRNFAQELINGLDKTTNDGFAEALLIAISNLKNGDGLRVNIRLSQDPKEMIDFAKQISHMMLHKEQEP